MSLMNMRNSNINKSSAFGSTSDIPHVVKKESSNVTMKGDDDDKMMGVQDNKRKTEKTSMNRKKKKRGQELSNDESEEDDNEEDDSVGNNVVISTSNVKKVEKKPPTATNAMNITCSLPNTNTAKATIATNADCNDDVDDNKKANDCINNRRGVAKSKFKKLTNGNDENGDDEGKTSSIRKRKTSKSDIGKKDLENGAKRKKTQPQKYLEHLSDDDFDIS